MKIKTGRKAGEQGQEGRFIPGPIQDQIKAAAAADIVDLCRAYLPSDYIEQKPRRGSVTFARKKEGRTYTATVSGKYAGWVKDWRGKNLDAVALVREYAGARDYLDALHLLAARYGIDTGTDSTEAERAELVRAAEKRAEEAKAKRTAKTAQTAKQAAAEEARHKAYAARYWGQCVAITPDSPADLYLTKTRGIRRPVEGWPAGAMRFHAGDCALVVGLADYAGTVRTAQRIFLTLDGGKKPGAGKLLLKGDRAGLLFKLPSRVAGAQAYAGQHPDPIAACEGPETALTVWAVTGLETWASIGAGASIEAPHGHLILHCRDDDAEGSPAFNAADRAADGWLKARNAVVTVWPWPSRKQDKTDLNDLLLAEGEGAVRRAVMGPLNARLAAIAACNPIHPPVADARKIVAGHAADWFAGGWKAERTKLLTVGTGIGKTRAAIREAVTAYRDAKDSGRADGRPLVLSFPDHKLTAEKLADVEQEAERQSTSLVAKVWKGRKQNAVEAQGDEPAVPMCRNLDEVQIILDSGQSASEWLCNAKDGCPFREGCPYMAQTESKGVDVWVIPHATLFQSKPSAIGRPLFLVIDEPHLASNAIISGERSRAVSSVSLPNQDADYGGNSTARMADPVRRHISMMHTALEGAGRDMEAGECRPMHRQHLERMFSHTDLPAILSDLGRVQAALKPAHRDDLAERAPLLKQLAVGASLLKEADRVLTDTTIQATPRITLIQGEGKDLRFRLSGKRDIGRGWLEPVPVPQEDAPEGADERTPVLLLDATPNTRLLQDLFPDLAMGAHVQASTPHARFTFMTGAAWGLKAQKDAVEKHQKQAAEGRTNSSDRGQTIEGIRFTLWRHWLASGRRPLLAVMGKALHEYLAELDAERTGFLPPGCELAHFGATRGLNRWETVATILVFGRNLPPVIAMQDQAEALLGRTVEHVVPAIHGGSKTPTSRPDQESRTRILPDGREVTVARYTHPDETVRAFLETAVDGETIQAIGRGRAVNRRADNPLVVFVYADTYPDALPLDDVQAVTVPAPWERMAVTDAMNSQGASQMLMPVLTSGADAARAYPHIWDKETKAKEAFRGEGISVGFPYKSIIIRKTHLNQNGDFCGKNGSNPPLFFLDLLASNEGYIVRYKPDGRGQGWRFAWVPDEWRDGFREWIAKALGLPADAVAVELVDCDPPEPPDPPPARAPLPLPPSADDAPAQIQASTAAPWTMPDKAQKQALRKAWRCGAISRESADFMTREAWLTGHEEWAEADVMQPGLAWLMEQGPHHKREFV